MAVITMRQMLEAGVHFGHQTRRWNPKMKRFIFGERNGIYIIDLEQTLGRVERAYDYVRDLVAGGGVILFVGTKKQAQDPVRSYAEKCGMPYVNERWLGGMLTNFDTISKRVGKMLEYERMRDSGEFEAMPKKEALLLTREMEKLQRNLGGLRGMTRKPDAIFVLDTKKEHIAVTEANKLGIPVVAVVDTNVDPELVQYPIPGNDDAIRANSLLARVIADAVEEGRFIAAKRDPGNAPVTRSAEQEAAFAAQQAEARNAAARAQAEREARLAAAREATPANEPAEAPATALAAEPDAAPAVSDVPTEAPEAPAATLAAEPDAVPAVPDVPAAEPAAEVGPRPRPPTRPTTRRADRDGVHRQGRPGPAPGHRRRDDGCEEGPRGQRRRHGGRQELAARAGPRRQRQARRPGEHPGRRRPRRRRAGRRARRAEVRDRLRRRQRALQARGPGAGPPRRRQGRGRRRRSPGPPRGPQDHAQGEDRARARRAPGGGAGDVIDSYLHIQGGRGVNGVLVVLAGGSPAAGPRHRRARRLRPPEVPLARRRPGRRRRGRAPDARDDHPQRGQARAGDRARSSRAASAASSRRSPCSTSPTPRTTSRRSASSSARPRIVAFAQVEIG